MNWKISDDVYEKSDAYDNDWKKGDKQKKIMDDYRIKRSKRKKNNSRRKLEENKTGWKAYWKWMKWGV